MTTPPAELEAAWQRFLCADIPVATVLALEDADVDNDELTRLQLAMQAGTPAQKGNAADLLRALLVDVKNALVLDGLVAAGLDAAERHADALLVRTEALAVAARWHLVEAGRLVGNIAHDLLKLGRLDEARAWYERALAWDPANPFVVVGLAEVHLARGELDYAFAYREHLADEGYPASHTADFDAAVARLGVRHQRGPVYVPDLGSLFALDEAGYARQCAAFQFDRNATAKESLRAHALACLMRGHADRALWTASLAAATPWNGDHGERGATETAWCHAVLRAMTARLAPSGVPSQVVARIGTLFTNPDEPHDDEAQLETRLATLEELARRGDHGSLASALFDPHPGLRLAAASGLTAAGDPRARVFLHELATYERVRGLDSARPELAPSASRLRWLEERRRALAGRAPLIVPEEGIEHPSLAVLEPGQLLSVMMTFVDPLDDDRLDRIRAVVVGVLDRVDWDHFGGACELVVEHDDVSLHVAFVKHAVKKLARRTQPGDLRPVVRDVLAAASSASPFAEVLLSRQELPRKGSHVLQPVDDPRDTDPVSEPEGGLFMMFPSPAGHVPERRNARLWLQDLRICYGLPAVDYREPDARCTQVEAAVTTAFERVFRGLPPRFRDRHGAVGRVNALVKDGRRGYGIFVDGMDPRFLMHYPSASRFREYELFQAVREVCGAVGLRPVVHWYREGGTYLVNVWEWDAGAATRAA
ncbi:MAG TPA: tetratricopeptide repeat protein [Kofleriaceae bacterium]|nr:tetratricopeptide repeat protein [Kofleriaceae bacterium]